MTDTSFITLEKMFREPISYSGLHASVAVLTMADGVKDGVVMPAVVRAFMASQLQLVSIFSLVLRLGRVVLLLLVQRRISAGCKDFGETIVKVILNKMRYESQTGFGSEHRRDASNF